MLPIAIDTTPTASASGAPMQHPGDVSRPKPSVPKTCAALGREALAQYRAVRRFVDAAVPSRPIGGASRTSAISTSPIMRPVLPAQRSEPCRARTSVAPTTECQRVHDRGGQHLARGMPGRRRGDQSSQSLVHQISGVADTRIDEAVEHVRQRG